MWEYSYEALNGNTTLWGWNRVFGEGGSQQLLLSYQSGENTELIYDQFTGAPGEVMSAKMTTLDDMLDQAFLKIISNQQSLDTFDTVVSEWEAAGGTDVTAEVNEWYSSNQ